MRIFGALVCLLIAIAYYRVWPGRNDPGRVQQRSFWSRLILRWFHSFAWLLLSLACVLKASVPAGVAGLIYSTFLITLAHERKSAERDWPSAR